MQRNRASERCQRAQSSSIENSPRKALAVGILCWLTRCLQRPWSHFRKWGGRSWDDRSSKGRSSSNEIVISAKVDIYSHQLGITMGLPAGIKYVYRLRLLIVFAGNNALLVEIKSVDWNVFVLIFNWKKPSIPCLVCESSPQCWLGRCQSYRDGTALPSWKWELLLLCCRSPPYSTFWLLNKPNLWRLLLLRLLQISWNLCKFPVLTLCREWQIGWIRPMFSH